MFSTTLSPPRPTTPVITTVATTSSSTSAIAATTATRNMYDLSEPPPLAAALHALGYAPAATASYDWLHSIRDARPFLHALYAALSSSSSAAAAAAATRQSQPTAKAAHGAAQLSVLTQSEAQLYSALQRRQQRQKKSQQSPQSPQSPQQHNTPPLLSDVDAHAAAAPLLAAPDDVPSPHHARVALVDNLRQRLAHLHANADIMQDIITNRDNATATFGASSGEDIEARDSDADDDSAGEALSTLRDLLLDLDRAARLHLPPSTNTSTPTAAHLVAPSALSGDSDAIAEYVTAERAEASALSTNVLVGPPLSTPRPPSTSSSDFSLGGGNSNDDDDHERGALIRSYAQLRANLCLAEAHIIRAETTEAELSSTDGDAFVAAADADAPHLSAALSASSSLSSLHTLASDMRRRAAQALTALAGEVTTRAAQWLRDVVHAHVLQRVIACHERRITGLERAVEQLAQQRVRVICVHGVQTQHALHMRELNDALAVLERPVATANSGDAGDSRSRGGAGQLSVLSDIDGDSQITIDDNDSADDGIVAKTTNAVENAAIAVMREAVSSRNEIDCDGEITIDDNHSADDGIFANAADAAEDAAYAFVHEEASSLISQFRDRIGCIDGWLDLKTTPAVASAMTQLEDELASNTVVLETLLRNHTRIQSGMVSSSHSTASPSSSSASNRDWVRLVNAAHSQRTCLS